MTANTAPTMSIFQDISFNKRHIEEYLYMEPLSPLVFDKLCEDGWVYWSDLFFKKNYTEWKGEVARVVNLRLVMSELEFTKSQRKCIRRNADLDIKFAPISLTDEQLDLFNRHAERFDFHKPGTIFSFFSPYSHIQPCTGYQLCVYKSEKLIAVSYIHSGSTCIAGNYCIFDPEEGKRSLGLFTMLAELNIARNNNKKYYYPGFVYDTPSEFDYKLNFNGLEYNDWYGCWYPLDRLPVREWRADENAIDYDHQVT